MLQSMDLRLLAINATKKVPLVHFMAYENSPTPLSIFTQEGKTVTCVKSDFIHKLDGLIPGDKIISIPSCDAIIYDGHASIQMLDVARTCINFQNMAHNFMTYIFNHSRSVSAENATQIHVVFDKYPESSVKAQARENLGERHLEVHV